MKSKSNRSAERLRSAATEYSGARTHAAATSESSAAAIPTGRSGGALAAAAIVAVLTFLLYWPALSYQYIGWDDTNYIVDNPHMTAPDGLIRIWTKPAESPQYYPLTFSSFWLEHRLWKNDARGYHAVSIALHALSAALVLLLLRAYGLSALLALAIAALFATAPIQVMSVAWIAERKNTLSTFLALLSLLAYARYFSRAAGGAAYAAAGILAALAAILAKTALLPLPLVAALAGVWIQHATWRRAIAATAGPLLAGAVIARMTVSVEQQYNDLPLPSFSERLLIAPAALLHYVGVAVVPRGLSVFYPLWNEPPSRVMQVGLMALAILALFAGVLAWNWKRLHPVVRWGLVSFALLLAPALGLVPFGNMSLTWLSDHFAYAASIALYAAVVALVAGALGRFAPRAAVPVTTAIALLAAGVFAAQSRAQLPNWENDRAFWNAVVQQQPEHFIGYVGRAAAFHRAGQQDQAIADQQRAVALRPTLLPVRIELADILLEGGRTDEAEGTLRRVLADMEKRTDKSPAERQDRDKVRINLASLVLARGQVEEARQLVDKVEPTHPQLVEALLNAKLGIADQLARNGRLDEADALALQLVRENPNRAMPHLLRADIAARRPIAMDTSQLLEAALAAEPGSARAARQVALMYFASGRPDDAERVALAGLAANPHDAELGRWLAKFYRDRNQPAKSEPILRRILEAEPDDSEALFSLGESLHALGRPEESLPFYERLVQKVTNDAKYWNNYGGALLDAKRVNDAIPKIEKALQLDAADAKAWHNLGVAKVMAKDRPGAIECFTKATELNPQYGRAQDALTRLLVLERRYKEALDRCNMAINSMGLENSLPIASRFARILSACPDDAVRNPELGLRAAKRLLEGGETVPDYLDTNAIANAANANYEEAIRLGTKASELFESQNRPQDAAAAAERVEMFRRRQVYLGD